jgi:GNAT superfamily N-acetyltransferase
MITVQREKFSDVYEESKALLEEHWSEISSFSDIKLNVDHALYSCAEEKGILRVFTIRDDSVLVGYLATFVRGHIHYKESLQSFVDVVFLKEEYRNAGTGKKLIDFVDNSLKAEGVQINQHHVKIKHPALGKLLEHLGYETVETTYVRRLDKWPGQ